MKPNFLSRCGLIAASGLLIVGIAGCSQPKERGTPTYMSVGDLETSIARKISEAGGKSQSVQCDGGLVADRTAQCDVEFAGVDATQSRARVIVTATGADESNLTFDLTPVMSREDVEKAVAGMAAVPAAQCQTGLEGRVGTSTKCTVMDSDRIVEVAKVDPAEFRMELASFSVLPKQQVQDILLQRLFADGMFVDSVECASDVAAKTGSTVECIANTGGLSQRYDVTVVQTPDGFVNLDYRTKP